MHLPAPGAEPEPAIDLHAHQESAWLAFPCLPTCRVVAFQVLCVGAARYVRVCRVRFCTTAPQRTSGHGPRIVNAIHMHMCIYCVDRGLVSPQFTFQVPGSGPYRVRRMQWPIAQSGLHQNLFSFFCLRRWRISSTDRGECSAHPTALARGLSPGRPGKGRSHRDGHDGIIVGPIRRGEGRRANFTPCWILVLSWIAFWNSTCLIKILRLHLQRKEVGRVF